MTTLSKVSSTHGLLACLGRLSLSHPTPAVRSTFQQTRNASHATQGVANRASRGPGKRLGAKKGDSELVVPGNIIYRQRGSKWHPGENCVMGRDHTISALVKGYVRFYRDPARHKTRKYIGVVFEQEDRLPRHASAPRQRRLGMEARPVVEAVAEEEETVDIAEQVKQAVKLGIGRRLKVNEVPDTAIREGYQVRETYKSIGRVAEREGIVDSVVTMTRKRVRRTLQRRIEGRATAHLRRRGRK